MFRVDLNIKKADTAKYTVSAFGEILNKIVTKDFKQTWENEKSEAISVTKD